MLLRGGDLEKADLFPGLSRSGPDPGRAKMRVRPQAAVNRRSLRAEGDPMADHQSRPARKPRLPVALILLAAFVLGACVQSMTPLMTGSKQLLGERFQLNTFEDVTEGKAVTVKTGVYRWSATRYALVSGNVSDVKFPSIQPLDDNEFLIEATDDNDYEFAGPQADRGNLSSLTGQREEPRGDAKVPMRGAGLQHLHHRDPRRARHVRARIGRQDDSLQHGGGDLGRRGAVACTRA
jgi:hypothetical protein